MFVVLPASKRENADMLRFMVGGLFVCGWLVGCADPEPEVLGDDVLQLELGGAHQPLRAALEAVSRAHGQRSSAQPQPPAEEPREERQEDPPEDPPSEDPPPRREPRVEPPADPPAPEPRIAVLGRGQTIYALAGEHLGDSNRWKEILKLNGWTEERAAKLPPGTKVELPER